MGTEQLILQKLLRLSTNKQQQVLQLVETLVDLDSEPHIPLPSKFDRWRGVATSHLTTDDIMQLTRGEKSSMPLS